MARSRNRLIEYSEGSSEVADPYFAVMLNSVVLSSSLARLSHCEGVKKGYSIYLRFKF